MTSTDINAEIAAALKHVGELADEVKSLRMEISEKIEGLQLLTLISAEDFSKNPTAMAALGGERELKIAVWNLYDRIVHDPQLSPYFRDVDMGRVRRKQLEMFLALLGISDYAGPSISTAHAPHDITRRDFDRMLTVVDDVLTDIGMEANARLTLIQSLRDFEPDVVHVGRYRA